jgi:hypothetical protein
MIRASVLTAATALALASATGPVLASDDTDYEKVMGTVHVQPGEHAGKATTVNGSVDIGANAVVKHAETVNGSIVVHEHAAVGSVETVNGSIDILQGAQVDGKAELVNGNMTLEAGAAVGGHLSNVNGTIQLTAAHVGGGIETTNGNLTVGANSRIEGGILYGEAGWSWLNFFTPQRLPRVIIEPGAIVQGTLRFRREVKLYVSDQATIGPVEGATVIKFSGPHP